MRIKWQSSGGPRNRKAAHPPSGGSNPRAAPATIGATLAALALVVTTGCAGFQGRAFVREADGSIGPTLPDVELTFTREDGSASYRATTDAGGSYRRLLAVDRYRVTAQHPVFADYDSAPGFFVVTGGGLQTGNIFLQRHKGTVVILTRHAEKASSETNTDLATDPTDAGLGLGRAAILGELAVKAEISAVLATDWCRTAQTAQPAAAALGLTIEVERSNHPLSGFDDCDPPITAPFQLLPAAVNTPDEIAAHITSSFPDQTVLVVGHSNTVPQIVESLSGASVCPAFIPFGAGNSCAIPEEEFNHVFVVKLPGDGDPISHGSYGAP